MAATAGKNRYYWGMDLAESLNYCGISVGQIIMAPRPKIRLVNLRKFRHVVYPEIHRLCTAGELGQRFRPVTVAVDYTNEKSFSESLETYYNPGFTHPTSANYLKWKTVEPVKFTQQSKLAMKQNSRQMHEAGLIEYPDRDRCSPAQQALLDELMEQLQREAAEETPHGLRFPKPENHDNDLAIAHELMLWGCRKALPGFVPQMPRMTGTDVDLNTIYYEQQEGGDTAGGDYDLGGGKKTRSLRLKKFVDSLDGNVTVDFP